MINQIGYITTSEVTLIELYMKHGVMWEGHGPSLQETPKTSSLIYQIQTPFFLKKIIIIYVHICPIHSSIMHS